MSRARSDAHVTKSEIPTGTGSGGDDLSIGLSIVSSSLLFMARGGFLPFFFVIYEHITTLSYNEIALLLNTFVFIQAGIAPFSGRCIDSLSGRSLALGALAVLASALGFTLTSKSFISHLSAIMLLGTALTVGRIAFNKAMLSRSSMEQLRRVVSIRATLMNVGSFVGNLLAVQVAIWVGYEAQLIFFVVAMALAWLFFLLQPKPLTPTRLQRGPALQDILSAFRHRAFVADLLKLLVALVPYGCWGTIIPKFIIDHYGSANMVSLAYATSMITILSMTYLFNTVVFDRLYRIGMRTSGWPVIAFLLFATGMLILGFGTSPWTLSGGVFVFIMGEIAITPCLDEVVKRHANEDTNGTYYGVVQMIDSSGRLIGSFLALSIYGYVKGGTFALGYWPLMVVLFASIGLLLHQMSRWVLPPMQEQRA